MMVLMNGKVKVKIMTNTDIKHSIIGDLNEISLNMMDILTAKDEISPSDEISFTNIAKLLNNIITNVQKIEESE